METWKEKFSKSLYETFEWLGIDPLWGMAILLLPLLIWKAQKLKEFTDQELWEKLFDIGFFIGIIGFYFLLIILKFVV